MQRSLMRLPRPGGDKSISAKTSHAFKQIMLFIYNLNDFS